MDGEFGGLEAFVGQMGDDHRRTERDGTRADEIHVSPQTHVLVGGSGVPVDPVDTEVVLGGGEDLHGKNVRGAWLERICYIEVIGAVSARDLRGIRDLEAVEPNLRAIVDAAEVEPVAAVRGGGGRRGEGIAVPPAAVIRAVGGHGEVSEELTDGIGSARNLTQVIAEVRIGKNAGCDLRGQDGRGDRSAEPILGGEAGGGDCIAGGLEFAGGLQAPAVVQRSYIRRVQRGRQDRGGEKTGENVSIHRRGPLVCANSSQCASRYCIEPLLL